MHAAVIDVAASGRRWTTQLVAHLETGRPTSAVPSASAPNVFINVVLWNPADCGSTLDADDDRIAARIGNLP